MLSTNVDQKSLETEFLIAISKNGKTNTLLLAIFYPRLLSAFSIAAYPMWKTDHTFVPACGIALSCSVTELPARGPVTLTFVAALFINFSNGLELWVQSGSTGLTDTPDPGLFVSTGSQARWVSIAFRSMRLYSVKPPNSWKYMTWNTWHVYIQPLKRQSQLQQTTNFETYFPIFEKNKVWYFMRIVCQQTILMKYHALFVIFEKATKFKLSSAAKYRWRFKG